MTEQGKLSEQNQNNSKKWLLTYLIKLQVFPCLNIDCLDVYMPTSAHGFIS
jgi:hypothetical protein